MILNRERETKALFALRMFCEEINTKVVKEIKPTFQ